MVKRKQMKDYHNTFVELAQKHTLPEISKLLELSSSSVSRYLAAQDIQCVVDRDNLADYHDQIVSLIDNDLNIAEIADMLNIKAGSLRSYALVSGLNFKKVRKGNIKLTLPLLVENRYYVYGHYTENNVLFYVGKGTDLRKDNKFSRSKVWTEFTAKNKWYSKILVNNLTEQEALLHENEIIGKSEGLLNIVNSYSKLNLQDVVHYFYYDTESPSGLRWKVWNGQTNSSKRMPGDIAGFSSYTKNNISQGYRVGCLGKEYKAHRLIMQLHGIDCEGKVVDHIDGNPLNNKFENLRVISQSENARNISVRDCNSTGISGVSIINRYNTWFYRATVSCFGSTKSKVFNVTKYGIIPAFYKACEWRKEQIRLLNEQGAGYTDRHGT